MKKHLIFLILSCILPISGYSVSNKITVITFSTSAEYPPFEYMEKDKLTGFDIELAKLVAKELGKEAAFENMQFSSILPALINGQVDAAISTITITEERKKNIDFSDGYYTETLATVFKNEQPITDKSQLESKKVACQMGTTMEIWLKKQVPSAEVITFDNNNQVIEALKADHVEVVLMDGAQAYVFSQKNRGLSFAKIAQSEAGYGIALNKGSALKDKINQALKSLESKGEIRKLEEKWLGAPK
jgi:polar amino acid transport system substrate-binding protein